MGDSMCALMFKFFEQLDCIRDIHQTFISLIPKIEQLEFVKYFQPISLCNVVYKLFTKILANWLKSWSSLRLLNVVLCMGIMVLIIL